MAQTFKRDDVIGAQSPAVALIGERRIQVAVAEDHLPVLESRPDDLLHQMGAGGRVKQGLGTRRHAVMLGVEQQSLMASPSGVPPGSRVTKTT